MKFSDDGTPQEHGWIRKGQEDGTISQPANLYVAAFIGSPAIASRQ